MKTLKLDHAGKTLQYYAVAGHPSGKIGQLRVNKMIGKPGFDQKWTGVFYPTMRKAMADLAILNRGIKIEGAAS